MVPIRGAPPAVDSGCSYLSRVTLHDITDPGAVRRAIAEADALGEQPFLEKYGFGQSRRFRIASGGRSYPSKAILAAAHGYQYPERGPLAASDFSGGAQTTTRAQKLGFEILDVADDLGITLAQFMDLFKETPGEKFSGDHPASSTLHKAAQQIEALLPSQLDGAIVRASVGQGNWASVPWIAVLHPAITTSTQNGIYPVLLFHPDMESVEVTIAQGVTKLREALGRQKSYEQLQQRAIALRPNLTSLTAHGFIADSDYELGTSALARDYVASTIVHQRFDRAAMTTSDISDAVESSLQAYGDLLERGLLPTDDDIDSRGPKAVVVYVGQSAQANFQTGGQDGWWGWKEAPSGLQSLQIGDLIAFGSNFTAGSPRVDKASWQTHRLAEVTVGRITTPIQRTDQLVMPDELAGRAAYPWKIRFDQVGKEHDVALKPGDRLSDEASNAFRRSAITRGVGVMVPATGSRLFEEFLHDTQHHMISPTPASIMAAATAFNSAVDETGMIVRTADVQAFIAAIMTKPFAVLTGLSGSGKTQLAKRLGEWFGTDHRGRPRYLVVPVRPDWTGPEYLFGYPDVLRSKGTDEVWAVPDALEFMLRAAVEPREPFLLLLDEMNLAHVERYFADFLSGIESREPVLPELVRYESTWIATGNSQRIPLPRNLFVAGTVNVDETTYLFSPKVLDRAFTFEYRTTTAELDPSLRRPGPAGAAQDDHRATIAGIAADDDWHHNHPHREKNAIVRDLQSLHAMLTPSGHEFGHRVFYESLRYAAILDSVGLITRAEVLDRIVLTKILPKLHGTRSRLEKPLSELVAFAQGHEASDAFLPLTTAKAQRMLAVLREAQFVSFTE